MSTALVTALLSLLTSLLPSIQGGTAAATVIEEVVNTLIELLPGLVQLGEQFVTSAKNIIAVLTASGNVTAAQFQALQTAEAQLDADFEAAAAAAGDPATGA